MKDKIIHIPERGCHNCRHHYVNHKACNSPCRCKQGMEWRPLTQIPSLFELRDDLIQYSTNLLYGAYDEGKNKVKLDEFDSWVKERIEEIDDYFQTNIL